MEEKYPIGSLLIREKGLDCASGKPDSWPNISVFMGLGQTYFIAILARISLLNNYRYSKRHCY